MSKIFTVFLCVLFCFSFSNLVSQCDINATNYDFCANCTDGGGGTVDVDIDVLFTGSNNNFTIPSTCGGNPVSIGNITIDINNDGLTIPGGVLITGPITFASPNGDRTIVADGMTYTTNGTPSISDLESLIAACASDPGCTTLAQALPVELAHFEAKSKDKMVELAWTTSSELNNEFFQVEHSRDGLSFNSIGKVRGEGTTSETIEYDFMHRQPISGTNYYRLKQVDFDGAFEYSNVVVAVLANRTGGVQVYPNPTINKATISMNERPENIKFRLSNLLGQGIDLQPNQVDAGWELDLSKLANGIYVLRVDYNGQVISKRIVKK